MAKNKSSTKQVKPKLTRKELLHAILDSRELPALLLTSLRDPQKRDIIGEGGSGIVLKLFQSFVEDRNVERAVKFFIFSDELQSTLKRVTSNDNFDAEIDSLTQLDHPNIIQIIDGGFIRHTVRTKCKIPYIVTAYVNGPTLADLIFEKDDNGKTTIVESTQKAIFKEKDKFIQHMQNEDDVFDLFMQILAGLAYLHGKNFFHCDIAPKNIFIQGSKNNFFAILGDLGCGKFPEDNGKKIDVIGTKWYMPTSIQPKKNEKVDFQTFMLLQPQWDIYSVLKTFSETIEFVLEKNVFDECNALRNFGIKINHEIKQIDERELGDKSTQPYLIQSILTDIKTFRPSGKKIADIDGISDAVAGRSILQPLSSVFLPHRFFDIARHAAMRRLIDVPQIFCDLVTFPGANHNRYEHSLGTFQQMRKAIVTLFRNPEYSGGFDHRNVIGGLISAILSSLAHHPYSFVLNELLTQDTAFAEKHTRFYESRIFDTIIRKYYDDSQSLAEIIPSKFTEIEWDDIKYILFRKSGEEKDRGLEVSKFLLSSSLGAKTIDFISRDSLHIGFSYKIDEESLYKHFALINNDIFLYQSGIPIAEQIITNKYWMFKRIYWNNPNRANFAMLKYIFYHIFNNSENSPIIDKYYDSIDKLSSKEVLSLLNDCTMTNEIRYSINYQEERRSAYRSILYFGINSTFENSNSVYSKFRESFYGDQLTLRAKIEQYLIRSKIINATQYSSVRVLLDIPSKKNASKMGEDINVLKHDDSKPELNRASGIIKAIYDSFNDQVNVIRVLVPKEVSDKIEELKMGEGLAREIYSLIKEYFKV